MPNMKEYKLMENAARMGAVVHRLLTDLGEQHPSVGEVRSIGLFGVIELVQDRKTRDPLTPFNESNPAMNALRQFLLDQGVFLYTHWYTVLIIPPLCITEEQLAEGFSVLDKAFNLTDAAVGN